MKKKHLNYLPDEGEVYLEEELKGVKADRNSSLFLFFNLAIPVGIVLLILYLFGII
jgi:hypothetical protein